VGNDDFSEKVAEVDGRKPYLPVRGREPLDGGGQALRGEPHCFRCELFVREDEAQHVKRVHLGNVHALARTASHLAAADVLAVVVLRMYGHFFVPLGVSSVNFQTGLVFSRVSSRRRFRRFRRREKTRQKQKSALFFARVNLSFARRRLGPGQGVCLFDSADGHPH
jgi:hypothetical protein